MVWITLKEKKKKKREKKKLHVDVQWLSQVLGASYFQMCVFQLLLLSDRTGGDTFILKILDELQSSFLSQFYVLHPTEWGFFLLLHIAVVQFTQAFSAFPEAEKIDHNQETAAGHRWRHYLLLHGLEDEEGQS